MRILGIDPGLQHTGWGIIDYKNNALSIVDFGVIHSTSKDPISDRLFKIHNDIKTIIASYSPTQAAIEETYVNKNFASSLKLAHARAAAILSLRINGLTPSEYGAKTVKKTLTGSGTADKTQVIKMLGFLMPGLIVKNEDSADALAVAICHSRFYNPSGLV